MLTFLARNCARTALRAKVAALRPKLYRLAYTWCHDPALADDWVQEALLRALQALDQLEDDAKCAAWLCRILVNVQRDWWRAYRPGEDLEALAELPDPGLTPEQVVLGQEAVWQVRQAVAQLNDAQRKVLTLVDLMECSYIEVAEILGIPVGTVMSRLARARQRLQILLAIPAAQHQPKKLGLRSVK